MKSLIRLIDKVSAGIGKTLAWLTLAMILLTTYLVIARYVLRSSSIALQDVVLYMHAAVFMLGAAYALQCDKHVRVDVFYRGMSAKKKALVNIVGTILFLLPFSTLILWLSWGYAANAWRVGEGSANAGGLPYVYVLKTLIPVFAGLVMVQGIAELMRNMLILSGKITPIQED